MHSTLLLSLLGLTSVLALPGPRRPQQHHHHVKRAEEIVYATVLVTEYITMTAGQSPASSSSAPLATTTAAKVGNVALFASPASNVPTTLATSVAPTKSATPSSASSGSKKGLAWAGDNTSAMASLFTSGAVSWYFNWGTGSTSALSSLSFVPNQWGSNNLANVQKLPTGSTLLGFNEPDMSQQSAMTPAAAAALYLSDLTPLRKSGQIKYLGTPSISNSGSPGGITWLKQFMTACSACEIDFVSAHWYGPSLSLLESQMTELHTAFGLPVWLTEFAATNWNVATNPSASDISRFMTDALAWLESTAWIERYAWFGAMVITDPALGAANSLVTSDGSALSALGRQYMGLSS